MLTQVSILVCNDSAITSLIGRGEVQVISDVFINFEFAMLCVKNLLIFCKTLVLCKSWVNLGSFWGKV